MLYYPLFYLERIPGMKYDKNHALLETAIPGLPPPKSGKVRDVFDLGDTLLMVEIGRAHV